MSAFKVADSNEWTLAVGAFIINSGFADGEWFTLAMESDAFLFVVGTDGETTSSKSNNRNGIATIKLMQSSSMNIFLSGLHSTDLYAPNGAGVVGFLLKDRSGGTTVFSPAARIIKAPDISLDRTATAREWQIYLSDIQRTDGGN
jgi:hypothetical protein